MAEFNFRVISSKKIIDNLSLFRDKKVCAMVKANAYGFGLEAIVQLVKPYVEYFGVANIDEALQVRKLAPDSKVLIVGKTYDSALCRDNNISFAVCNVADALYAVRGSHVHIKLDSGMHRLGFNNAEELKTAVEILKEKDIDIEGVYTHFATLDCDDEYFQFQRDNFRKLLSQLPKDISPLIHVGGSWALSKELPEAEMIRIGKGLYYGAISIVSRIIRVFNVEPGDRVGYANSFIAKRKMKIGIVPIGYADGLKRCLANRYHVQIGSQKCKIIGNICMDMFAVDITGVNAFEGTQVCVLYDEASLAKMLKTSSYEVSTNFNHLRGRTIIK